jgi:hypothetical protein
MRRLGVTAFREVRERGGPRRLPTRSRLGSAAAGNVSFLSERAARSLAVIVAMLRTASQRRRKSTADSSTSSSSRHPRTYSPGTRQRPRARASGSPIGEAYGRFLEMAVPVVLAAMWLLGALVLGAVVGVLMVVAYWAYALLLSAIAQV